MCHHRCAPYQNSTFYRIPIREARKAGKVDITVESCNSSQELIRKMCLQIDRTSQIRPVFRVHIHAHTHHLFLPQIFQRGCKPHVLFTRKMDPGHKYSHHIVCVSTRRVIEHFTRFPSKTQFCQEINHPGHRYVFFSFVETAWRTKVRST